MVTITSYDAAMGQIEDYLDTMFEKAAENIDVSSNIGLQAVQGKIASAIAGQNTEFRNAAQDLVVEQIKSSALRASQQTELQMSIIKRITDVVEHQHNNDLDGLDQA